jgi:hypothetical protein
VSSWAVVSGAPGGNGGDVRPQWMSGWDEARDSGSGNDLHSNTNVPNNMDPSDDSKIGPSESGGHPPAQATTRKMATRDGKESTRSGGVSALAEPGNQDVDFASRTNVSSRGEDDGNQGNGDTSAGGDRPSDTTHGNQISGDKHEDDQLQSDKDQGHQARNDEHEIGQLQDESKHETDVESTSSDQGQQGKMKEYDAESRTYHSYYEVSSAPTYNPL